MPSTFAAEIGRLAVLVGVDPAQAAVDEHARWELYRKALADVRHRPNVLRVLSLEPNTPLASATVVHALEVVSAREGPQWVSVLRGGPQHDFAGRRLRELSILLNLRDDPQATVLDTDIDGWSQWLQLKVAEHAVGRSVLGRLAEVGSTKRVRRTALARLEKPGES